MGRAPALPAGRAIQSNGTAPTSTAACTRSTAGALACTSSNTPAEVFPSCRLRASRSPGSRAFLRLLGSFGIFPHFIPTGTAQRSGDPLPTEPSVAPPKAGPSPRGRCAGFVCCITIGEFSGTPAALGFDWFFHSCAARGPEPIHMALLGLGSVRQGSVKHRLLTLSSGGPWDRGNPCPRRPKRGGRRGMGLGAAGSSAPARSNCRHPGRSGVSCSGHSDRFSRHPTDDRAARRGQVPQPRRLIGTRVPRRQRRPPPANADPSGERATVRSQPSRRTATASSRDGLERSHPHVAV
jgi:hypothetical protein